MIAAVLEIADAVTRLAVARGSMLDDVASEVYTDGLKDLSPVLVSQACRQLGLEIRAEFDPAMPALATIRERVARLAEIERDKRERSKLLPLPRSEDANEPVFVCLQCHDEPNAWRSQWCQGSGSAASVEQPARAAGLNRLHCGRPKDHPQHTWVDRCACSETNPVIRAHRERQRAHVQKKAS